jgi:hypothetical protein
MIIEIENSHLKLAHLATCIPCQMSLYTTYIPVGAVRKHEPVNPTRWIGLRAAKPFGATPDASNKDIKD